MRDFRIARGDQSLPELVVAKQDTDPTVLTEKAIAALGGMGRFVATGDVVAIKPNMAWERTPAQGANTNPLVVAALVRAVKQAGARRIVVTDTACNDPARSFEMSGIARAASNAGAEVIVPTERHYRDIEVKGGVIDTWTMLEPLLSVQKVINVPVVKHHARTKLTCGLKNWFGLIGGERQRLHEHLHVAIADLAVFMRPTLTVVDGTRVMLRNGPRGGNIDDTAEKNTVIASIDPVAADSLACGLLGLRPDQIEYLRLAEARGVGTTNWQRLRSREV
jgi:uncharacterized protein (DUF362 family)